MIQVQAVDLGIRVNNMTKLRNRLFCRLDSLTPAIREQKRLQVLSQLGLLAAETVPVFEEATLGQSIFYHGTLSYHLNWQSTQRNIYDFCMFIIIYI